MEETINRKERKSEVKEKYYETANVKPIQFSVIWDKSQRTYNRENSQKKDPMPFFPLIITYLNLWIF